MPFAHCSSHAPSAHTLNFMLNHTRTRPRHATRHSPTSPPSHSLPQTAPVFVRIAIASLHQARGPRPPASQATPSRATVAVRVESEENEEGFAGHDPVSNLVDADSSDDDGWAHAPESSRSTTATTATKTATATATATSAGHLSEFDSISRTQGALTTPLRPKGPAGRRLPHQLANQRHRNHSNVSDGSDVIDF
jgi:hypothetical protein